MQQMCAAEFSWIHKFAPTGLSEIEIEFNATPTQRTFSTGKIRKLLLCLQILRLKSAGMHETDEETEKFQFLILLIARRVWEMFTALVGIGRTKK